MSLNKIIKKGIWDETIILSVTILAGAIIMAVNFDISVFENNPRYLIKADQKDGMFIISPAEDRGSFADLSENEESPLFGKLDIRILKDMPPMLVLTIEYRGNDWVNADYVIAAPRKTRYTFEVTNNREKEAGGSDVIERYTICLTNQSIGLLNDMIRLEDTREINLDVLFRLTGNQIIDGNLTFGIKNLKHILNDYTASGALNNDFSALSNHYPCKMMKKQKGRWL